MKKRFYLSKLKVVECENNFKKKRTFPPLYNVTLVRNKHNKTYIEYSIFRYDARVYLTFTEKDGKTLIEARFKNDYGAYILNFFLASGAVLLCVTFIRMLSFYITHVRSFTISDIWGPMGFSALLLLGFSAYNSLNKKAWRIMEEYIIKELQSEKMDGLLN